MAGRKISSSRGAVDASIQPTLKCQLITHSNSGLRMPILCSISLSFTGSGLRDTWKKSVDLPSVSRLRSKQKTGEPFSGVGMTWESIPPIFKATY